MPVQRMRAAINRIDFHVMARLPRSSWESVECSISTDRANARKEYRGFIRRRRANSFSRIVRNRMAAEAQYLCREVLTATNPSKEAAHPEDNFEKKVGQFRYRSDHRRNLEPSSAQSRNRP